MTEPRRLTFRARHRLTHALEFKAVYDAGLSKVRGPLIVFARPNDRANPRLGLSVSRAAGGAVERNRIKRAVREAFRHLQHDLPAPGGLFLDFVVRVRKHDALEAERYRQYLADAAAALARAWVKRGVGRA